MKLLLSDTPLTVSLKTENEMYIDLSALKISNCVAVSDVGPKRRENV